MKESFVWKCTAAALPALTYLRNKTIHSSIFFAYIFTIYLFTTIGWEPSAQADKIDRLIRIIQTDPSYKVKLKVLITLGRLKDRRAVPAMIKMLSDSNYMLRGVSAAALAQMGDRRPLPRLKKIARTDPNSFVRVKAKHAIKRLSKVASTPKRPSSDPPSERRSSRQKSRFLVRMGKLMNCSGTGGNRLVGILKKALQKAFSKVRGVTTHWSTRKPSLKELRKQQIKGYTIIGAIKQLKHRNIGRNTEIYCSIQVSLISYPSNSIRAIYSGEASMEVSSHGQQRGFENELYEDLFEGAAMEAQKYIVRSYLKYQ